MKKFMTSLVAVFALVALAAGQAHGQVQPKSPFKACES